MGNCIIVIELNGEHYNIAKRTDINRMTAAFVDQLIEAGHAVKRATFTAGATEDLLDPASYTRAHDHDVARKIPRWNELKTE